MKKIFSIVYFLLLIYAGHAQYKVQFILKEKTAIRHDSIFITGNFSNWDSSANTKYLLRQIGDNEKSITITINPGLLRYKFHRGSWLSVEKQDNGEEVVDRIITITKDTVLTDSVRRWRDQMFVDKWYALATEKQGSNRVNILASIANAYGFNAEHFNADSALFYAQTALQLQQRLLVDSKNKLSDHSSYAIQLINLKEVIASLMHALGNYPKALELRLENLKMAEKVDDKFLLISTIIQMATDYTAMKNFRHVLSYGKLADSLLHTANSKDPRFSLFKWNVYNTLVGAYYNLQMQDSALPYANEMLTIQNLPYAVGYLASAHKNLADIFAAKGNNKTALKYYRLATQNVADFWVAAAHEGMAKILAKEGQRDSALVYATRALHFYQSNTNIVKSWGESADYLVAEISPFIAELYKANGQLDSAYKYLQLSVILKDSLYNTDKVRQFQNLSFNEASRREKQEQLSREAKKQYETKIKIYGLIGIITAFIVLAFVLYRNNKQKQHANVLLQSQNKEIEKTLLELKNTQRQLIQSEKMASLGELTAGIAHEIQNPLNFVNNFSEVSNEMMDEMNAELEKGDIEEAKAISADIKQNLEKIHHHGKRADAIVKGMLQHSRKTEGEKEPTNINALTDEYLRLAYHGLRAKDNSFNAVLHTDYDEGIGNVTIISQDIGRVILNLITNAFYAVAEKKKQSPGSYDPTVWVSTKKLFDKVEIKVADNGSGIPQNIINKIFQPFFTTKPTGQGTGLGLSLAYDIVKAHGGELKVATTEDEGTTFIILLNLGN